MTASRKFGTLMRRGSLTACKYPVTAGLLLVFLSGCSRDPNVRKQKFFKSGEEYFAKARFQEAAIQFNNAIQIDPNFAAAHGRLAQSCLKTRELSCAFREFARTVDLEPQNSQARIELANLMIMGRNFPQAQEQVDILTKQLPNDPRVHVVTSNLFAAQDNFPGALGAMREAGDLDPQRWESYINLGLLQVKNNQADAAETSFKKAVEQNSTEAAPRLMLAAYYQSRSQFVQAEEQFRQAIANAPKDPEPRAAMSRLYLRSEEHTSE